MPRLKKTSRPTMSHITINTSGAEKLIGKLNPHKATGTDIIPAHLLCKLSAEVAPALTFVFKMSLDTGQVPNDWHYGLYCSSL